MSEFKTITEELDCEITDKEEDLLYVAFMDKSFRNANMLDFLEYIRRGNKIDELNHDELLSDYAINLAIFKEVVLGEQIRFFEGLK